ncbi:MAG: beta-N-acetylhexosaminidase [Deltaproteobacteria bacterium]|nr:beta-N-acetylhexosaminidase [Deltaproteobacteria bacterium]
MDRQVLRRLIGRVLMVGIPGPELDEATRTTLARLAAGGVILFRRNVLAPAQLAALTEELHRQPARPLIGIDHEGGRVQRLGAPFTVFPAMAVVGATGEAALARQVGRAMGIELAAAGIDLDFAPVLDVNSNPANPIIGDRAFSHDPAVVAAMGVALMHGLHEGGVLSCGKHFPGHGDTDSDSHLALPVVPRDRAALESTELVPFRAAVRAGMPLLMTAHVLYPALDQERPATLSPAVLRDLLRTQLGFTGVIVSDDLGMCAITDHHDVGEAAVQTLAAGAELLLLCSDLAQAVQAASAIERAVVDGRLAAPVLEAAATRVRQLAKPSPVTRAALRDLPIAAHAALRTRLETPG